MDPISGQSISSDAFCKKLQTVEELLKPLCTVFDAFETDDDDDLDGVLDAACERICDLMADKDKRANADPEMVRARPWLALGCKEARNITEELVANAYFREEASAPCEAVDEVMEEARMNSTGTACDPIKNMPWALRMVISALNDDTVSTDLAVKRAIRMVASLLTTLEAVEGLNWTTEQVKGELQPAPNQH